MPSDPFAVPTAFRKLESFIESLTGELRDRRGPLERSLRDLLLVAQSGFGRHELAVRLDAVGAVVREAGLRDEVQRMHAVRSASPNGVGGIEMNVAIALLDAKVNEQRDLLADLLARLHAEHHDLMPGVWAAFTRVAEQLVVVWCDRHATDFPIRFRDELQRIGLDFHLVDQWHLDRKPQLTEAAALVLDRLLDGELFALGWLDDLPDLEEQHETASTVNAMPTDQLVSAPANAVNATIKDVDDVAPISVITDEFAELLALAKSLGLKAKQRKLIELLCARKSPVPLVDVAMVCEWVATNNHNASATPIAAFADDWNSLRSRVNKRIEKHGWVLSRHDGCAVAERLTASARK